MNTRFRIYILAFVMLFVSVNTVSANTGNTKVDWLIEKGYVSGDSRGYRLNDFITRAEITKMVVEAGGFGAEVDEYKYLPSKFTDMNNKHWVHGYLNTAVINALVNGYPDNTFRPSNNITYAEVLKMLVMATGDVPNTSLYSGQLWAVPYIVKAGELGITDGVSIFNHYENATRGKVFELVFNTMFKAEPLTSEVYNGIVVENFRVSRLKGKQISLIVFEDLNDESMSPRYKINDKITIDVPEDIEDVEYLLGRVVDITIDNNNVALKVKEDNSYSYFEGPILSSEREVYLGTNGKYYDVNLKDRSSSKVERVLAVYHNDRSYDYGDYLDDLGDKNDDGDLTFIAEYANITVKNGKTYFIDSYTFEDISPVSDVSRKGSKIYIYDDGDDGQMSEVSINNIMGYTKDWGFETLDADDIRKGDVVHIYNRDSAIVRRDAKKNGEFYDLFEQSGFYFADIDDEIYQVRVSDGRRPIYSIDGESYKTLFAEEPSYSFFNLYDEEITYLIDINGHIQGFELK